MNSIIGRTSKQEKVFEWMKAQIPTPLDLVIVTGSSANHYDALILDWIPSMIQMVRAPAGIGGVEVSFIYYDLEPDSELTSEMMQTETSRADYNGQQTNATMENELLIKETYPFIEYRKFNYSNYPEHYHITKFPHSYAWKAAIFEEVVLQHRQSLVYWLDAGLLLKKSIFVDDAFTHLRHQGINTPASAGNLKEWTHRGTVQYLGLKNSIYEDEWSRICSGGIVLIDSRNQSIVDNIVKPWADCALHVECITPEGSSRANHRQDQSVLSVLIHKFGGLTLFPWDRSIITRGRQ